LALTVALVACALPSIVTLVAAPPAEAAAPINHNSKASVSQAYYERLLPNLYVAAGWTGSTATCNPGTERIGSRAATMETVNVLRDFAGLPPVTENTVWSTKALKAALMMRAANSLSHTPGPSWPCYSSDGAQAAGRSNLFLGSSGPFAMVGYVEDPGSNNAAVGHRRWLLNPATTQMGTGSTGASNALWVVPDTPSARPASPTWVSWPPPGYLPDTLLFPRFSLSANTFAGSADFSAATVAMKVNGVTVTPNIIDRTPGYADPTITWEPAINIGAIKNASSDTTIDVMVGNIGTSAGTKSAIYQTRIFDVPPGPPVPSRGDSFGRRDASTYELSNHLLYNNFATSFSYGTSSDEALVGDWNGNGSDSIGLRRGHTFYLRNTNNSGPPSTTFSFGASTDQAITGDWDGNGTVTVGLRRGNTFYLRNSNSAGAPNVTFSYGTSTDQVFVGDWNGDGKDSIGLRRGATFYLRNANSSGPPSYTFSYGSASDPAFVGDWDDNGTDTPAIRQGTVMYLSNANVAGHRPDGAFAFGAAGDIVLVGNWDGV
jgi:uncharacterized protein YkwD